MRRRLKDVDANLILPLHALLEERNLARASARIPMTKTAMSGALQRLRHHFGDDLLVAGENGLDLTPLGIELRKVVAEAARSAEALLAEGKEFDGATSTRELSISMSEYAMSVLAEPISRTLAEQAPHCSFVLEPFDVEADRMEAQLLRQELTIAPLAFDWPGGVQPVFTDRLVCVVSADHPALRPEGLTLADLGRLSHAVAELKPSARPRPLEVALAASGLADRRVQVRVTSMLTLPFAVAGTQLCAFIPSRLAARCADELGLTVARTPLDDIDITEAAHWHRRRERDPAVVWLRRILHGVAIEVEDRAVAADPAAP
nr:LysR family transcriptional regulator [Nocardioides sp. Iso805N]